MAGRSRLSIAKREIESHFDALDRWVLSARELAVILAANRARWNLATSLSAGAFIAYLRESSHLAEHTFRPTQEEYQRTVTRFTWRNPSMLEVGCGLLSHSYLSHGSAVFVHALNDEAPKLVYVNKEQSPKPQPVGDLRQEIIDRVFSQKSEQRKSQLIYTEPHSAYRYMILSGKNTNRAGVVSQRDPYGRLVDVTSIERTLIDIAVRPAYAGGVDRVVEAYRGARDRASIGRIIALLKSIGHFYPYHQCIGFYAEIAGFREAQLSRLQSIDTKVDFYLTYGMKNPSYVKRWRLFVPRELHESLGY